MAGEQPIEQGRSCAADMQKSGWRGCETRDDLTTSACHARPFPFHTAPCRRNHRTTLSPNRSIPGAERAGADLFLNTPIGALQHSWRHVATLSRYRREAVDRIDGFLGAAGFDKGPWLVVAFASGIVAWFILDAPMQWIIAIGAAVMLACLAYARSGDDRTLVNLRAAAIGLSVMFALGMSLIWLRSETVGALAIERPSVSRFDARILVRDEQPARDRVRLILAMRNPETGEAQKVRVNVPWEKAGSDLVEGAVIRLRARLMPPAQPMLPGWVRFCPHRMVRRICGDGFGPG